MSSNGDKAGLSKLWSGDSRSHGICLAFLRGMQRVAAVEVKSQAVETSKRSVHSRTLIALMVFTVLAFVNTLCAGEAVLSLAMVRYGEMQTRVYSGFDSLAAAISHQSVATSITVADEIRRSLPTFRLSAAEQNDTAFNFQLREPPQPPPRNPLVLRKNLANYGHSRAWASVNAGYGQIFKQSARLQRWNGAGWEEPSCGYVKISFSF